MECIGLTYAAERVKLRQNEGVRLIVGNRSIRSTRIIAGKGQLGSGLFDKVWAYE